MSIESSVMVAGELFSCQLSFTNTSNRIQTVAWAGAQLHCQCCYKRDVVKLPASNGGKAELSSPVTSTAFFPNRGVCVCLFVCVCLCMRMFVCVCDCVCLLSVCVCVGAGGCACAT